MADAPPTSEALRVKGNDAFKAGNLHDAVKLYSEALDALEEGDSSRALVLANRSLAYMRLKQPSRALEDADAALVARPVWGKGIHRRAKALESLGRHIEGYRMLVDVLDVPVNVTPDIDADQRKYLIDLLTAFRKRLQSSLRPSRFRSGGDGTTDEWLAAVETHESWRMRLATLAHCWNASDEAGRMAVLKAAQADLAAPPEPGSVPVEEFARQAARAAAAAKEGDESAEAGAATASAEAASAVPASMEVLETHVHELLGGAKEEPPDPEAAGVTESDLKPFPLHNYADITPELHLIRYFAALSTEEKGALWRSTWRRLRFFEKVLAANDFSMFFAPLIRLCPALDKAVTRLREVTEETAKAAAAESGEEASATAASGAGSA